MTFTAILRDGHRVSFWTQEAVEDRLREALHTLSIMPSEGCFPAGHKPAWPSVLQRPEDWLPAPGSPTFKQDWEHVKARVAEERNRVRLVPTAAAITRMEEALGWQHLVSPRRHFQALAAWILGEGVGETARRFRTSRISIWRWRRDALRKIVEELNNGA